MTSDCPFEFSDYSPTGNCVLLRIPRNLQTKQQLLDFYAEKLQFPEYFGRNWDALIDCLSDLSWLDGGALVIVHDDIPLIEDNQQVRLYLKSLRDVLNRWQSMPAKHLTIYFPAECHDGICNILARREEDLSD